MNPASTELSLELRLELVKHLGNVELYYLKCFYDRKSIPEHYTQHRLEAHTHGNFNNVPFCALWRCLETEQVIVSDKDEISMFIYIAKALQLPCPVASLVRLKP